MTSHADETREEGACMERAEGQGLLHGMWRYECLSFTLAPHRNTRGPSAALWKQGVGADSA